MTEPPSSIHLRPAPNGRTSLVEVWEPLPEATRDSLVAPRRVCWIVLLAVPRRDNGWAAYWEVAPVTGVARGKDGAARIATVRVAGASTATDALLVETLPPGVFLRLLNLDGPSAEDLALSMLRDHLHDALHSDRLFFDQLVR